MLDRKVHDAFHVSLLKPYFENKFGRTIEPPPPVQREDQQEEIEAEKILALRRRRGKFSIYLNGLDIQTMRTS